MAGVADGMGLPDASSKLRLVLDYLPCEACLADPVADQELLCTICARLDRQVAVRVGTRTTVLIERPTPAPEPIVIAPAVPEPTPEQEPAPPELHVRFRGDGSEPRPGLVEIIVERMEPIPSPVPMLLPLTEPAPLVAVAPPVVEEPTEPEFNVDDIATYLPAREEFFDYTGQGRARVYEVPDEPAAPEEVFLPPPPPPPPEDDFVFRPPQEEEPAPLPPPAEDTILAEDIVPAEEVPVEPTEPVPDDHWAPPSDFLQDEEGPETSLGSEVIPEPEPAQEIAPEPEQEIAPEPEPEPEEEIMEMEMDMEVIPDEPPTPEPEEDIMEMEVLPDDDPTPTPTGTGDLYRLRGFDTQSETALAQIGIHQLAHLSGHDAGDLSKRTGIPQPRLQPWIQAADLTTEIGVPIESANALVAAGIQGPRGLATADPDETADRVAAFGGLQIHPKDIRRWKRRT